MTAEDLIEAMGTHWRISGGNAGTTKEFDDSEPTDVVLGAFAYMKCFNCQEMGHMARNCPKPRSNANGGRLDVKCHECGGFGHKADRCWEHEKNANLRPDGWRSRKGKDGQETAAVEILIPSVEFMLGSLEIANEKVIDDCKMAASANEVCNVAALGFESGIEVCTVAANAKEVCNLAALMNESVKGACEVATPIRTRKRFA